MNAAPGNARQHQSAVPVNPDACQYCGLLEQQHLTIDGPEGPGLWCPGSPEAAAAQDIADKMKAGRLQPPAKPAPKTEPPKPELLQSPAFVPDPGKSDFCLLCGSEDLAHTGANYLCPRPAAAVSNEIAELERLAALRDAQELAEIVERISAPIAAGASAHQGEPPSHTEIPPHADGEPFLDVPSANHGTPPRIEIATLPPLTLNEWRGRDLPAPDFIMGQWLTTTSRVLLTAATGLGKTNFGLALGMRVAACEDFLHWRAHRPCRVLYIDGEMSRRLLRERVLDEEKRVGITPEFFFALSHEDIEGFKPLNTIEGQAWMNALIDKIGGVDLAIVDNIMSLTVGDMKDPEPWQHTIPWAHSLTKRAIGQVWIHHTGHDESRSYGDKSREWQMDTVAHLDAVKRDDTDVSFSMAFKKARERKPATRFDFQDAKIALVNDVWEHELTQTQRPGRIPPMIAKALDALVNVIGSDQAETLSGGRRAAACEAWKAECTLQGLIDPKVNAHSSRTLFSKFRRELVAANRIACEGDFSWLIH